MYFIMLFLPLVGCLVTGAFGRFFSTLGSTMLCSICVLSSCILSTVSIYEVAFSGSPCFFSLGRWVYSEMFDCFWGFQFDSLTVSMFFIVTFISFLVHVYSLEYMSHDPHQIRFFCYLSLFTFFMLVLISADNFIILFLGWEGVGLSSYLLINFWFTRLQANKAGIQAMIMNRIGDFGLTLGIVGLFFLFRTINFNTLFALVPYFIDNSFFLYGFAQNITISGDTMLTLICICLFIGACGKSAQLGLHTWLPQAMEGPSPVSALIHAATMVTAGVFMIIRCSPIFEQASAALIVLAFFGAMTAFFAATTGLVQNDLKKVIAYSTCSQLGYMVFACGLSNYSASMFHLMNHAYFKALLFLSAGAVIHALGDEQDLRLMGGLKQLLPFTYSAMLIGSLSLMGFPFLTGFYSKDVILELACVSYNISGSFSYWLGCISAFFTSFYSMRLIYLTFIRDCNITKPQIFAVHEAPFAMSFALVILSIGSIFIGFFTKDAIIGFGSTYWGNSIFILPEHVIMLEAEFLAWYLKLIPVFFSFAGALISVFLFYVTPFTLYSLKLRFRLLYTFLNKKWLFDKVYNEFVGAKALSFGYTTTFRLIDKGVIEFFGPLGFSKKVYFIASNFSFLFSGFFFHYAFFMLLGISFFLLFLFFSTGVCVFHFSFQFYAILFCCAFYLFYFSFSAKTI